MKRDDITKLASEAGFEIGFITDAIYATTASCRSELERFAALVAAAEREACAQACVASDLIDWPTSVEIAAIRKCAAAIRARSKA